MGNMDMRCHDANSYRYEIHLLGLRHRVHEEALLTHVGGSQASV